MVVVVLTVVVVDEVTVVVVVVMVLVIRGWVVMVVAPDKVTAAVNAMREPAAVQTGRRVSFRKGSTCLNTRFKKQE